MRVDEIKCLFDFRKMDGHWERRNIYGGMWFRLHVEHVQETVWQKRPGNQKDTPKQLTTKTVWTWR